MAINLTINSVNDTVIVSNDRYIIILRIFDSCQI